MPPLVSIIVPDYNNAKYLKGCLDSLINQTYKNIEIIVVNDGSKDNSEEIINEYKAKDSRIISYYQKNAGLPSARNSGLDLAKGEYIAFVDADDALYPNGIEVLVSFAGENTDYVIGSYTELWLYKKEHIVKKDAVLNEKLYDKFLEYISNSILVCKNLYKKSIIDEYNLRFDSTMFFAEDYYFNLNYLKHIKGNIEFCNIPVYKYYTYRSGQHRRYFPDMYKYYLRILDAAADFFEGKEYKAEYQKYFADFYMQTLIYYYTFNSEKTDAEEKIHLAFERLCSYFDESIIRSLFSEEQYRALKDNKGNITYSFYGRKLPYLKLKAKLRETALTLKQKIVL